MCLLSPIALDVIRYLWGMAHCQRYHRSLQQGRTQEFRRSDHDVCRGLDHRDHHFVVCLGDVQHMKPSSSSRLRGPSRWGGPLLVQVVAVNSPIPHEKPIARFDAHVIFSPTLRLPSSVGSALSGWD